MSISTSEASVLHAGTITSVGEAVDTAVRTEEAPQIIERIECIGKCHKGPIDNSPKAIRYAADHDPVAPAAFLLVCPGCDTQWALCEKKVDALLEWSLIRTEYMKCNTCVKQIPIQDVEIIPLNQ